MPVKASLIEFESGYSNLLGDIYRDVHPFKLTQGDFGEKIPDLGADQHVHMDAGVSLFRVLRLLSGYAAGNLRDSDSYLFFTGL